MTAAGDRGRVGHSMIWVHQMQPSCKNTQSWCIQFSIYYLIADKVYIVTQIQQISLHGKHRAFDSEKY